MPVFGYLAVPSKGAIDTLRADLSSMPYCEIIPAENRDVLVLVTDTPDAEAEKELQNNLKSLDSLQQLSMTFGHNDEQQPEK
jgi:nitrate reductase NapAB chaperone NapD